MSPGFLIRLANRDDISALEILIPRSVRGLQTTFYSASQMEAALGPVFGVDRQLIDDGTFFVVESAGQIVACGGWSRRHSEFGGDQGRTTADPELDPASDPARVRAFFVHPDRARRGIGRAILSACEAAMADAGFHSALLIATLPGEALYASAGYLVVSRYEVPLSGNLSLPVVRMTKSLQVRR